MAIIHGGNQCTSALPSPYLASALLHQRPASALLAIALLGQRPPALGQRPAWPSPYLAISAHLPSALLGQRPSNAIALPALGQRPSDASALLPPCRGTHTNENQHTHIKKNNHTHRFMHIYTRDCSTRSGSILIAVARISDACSTSHQIETKWREGDSESERETRVARPSSEAE